MRARRVDANLSDIVDAFRRLGLSVHVTNDAWDLTVGFGGLTMLVEVKDGDKSPSRGKLTQAQVKFRETWTGGIRLVQNLDDVFSTAKTLRQWRDKLYR